MTELFADIAVDLPVQGKFTYRVPDALAPDAAVGKRALVPFGRRTVTGYITGLSSTSPVDGAKDIIDILDAVPLFDSPRLKFYEWLSSYYFAPLGEVLSLTHPAGANIKSTRRVSLTEAGAFKAPSATGLAGDILRAAASGPSVSTLVRKFRNSPVYSTIERLKREGLLLDESHLCGGGKTRTERFVTPLRDAARSIDTLRKRSPLQARVLEYLDEHGPAAQRVLTRELGGVAQSIKRLEEKGLVEVTDRVVARDPFADIPPRDVPAEPNRDQAAAIEEISMAIRAGGYSPFLLYGVTGSGKTLVYIRLLEEAVRAGKKAIYLSPEISLTPWPAAYLARIFPGRVALAHSGLSEGERHDEWQRVLAGGADIVVGARSALFSPVSDLGLIIVDEEHESSYKQEEGVKYNARDAALMLAKNTGAAVVLGSATPSVESFHNAATGKLKRITLESRVMERRMPKVDLVDMKGRKGTVLSDELSEMLAKTLEGGHQALLFLNRRGFSNFLICRDCGHTFECLNCSVTLTMHKAKSRLKCHYCDFTLPIPDECPQCEGINLSSPGIGTEKIEEEVRALHPGVRVARMDRDTTRAKGSAQKIIDAVEAREVDVLIGTQMVSKGHHFPGITLVGVISGDTSLNIPDFRGSERTFQLITQAAGRAGRGEESGHVVVQTLNPANHCLVSAAAHDYEAFFNVEITAREELGYPPFARLACLRVEGPKDAEVATAASSARSIADTILRRDLKGITVLGPAPALLAKLKGRYRWNLLIKGADVNTLNRFVKALKKAFEAKKLKRVNLVVDIDPANIA